MRVKARAVILDGERLVVAHERRRGRTHVTLPGGRVHDRESVTEAVERELLEETGARVRVGALLYVAEVAGGFGTHDLNLVFAAELADPADRERVETVDLATRPWPTVWPPLLEQIAHDRADGWSGIPRWLGNVRQSSGGGAD